MRIDSFRADSFTKLEKKIDAIDWILFLPQNCRLKFKVTTRKSRLYHSDAIAQRCETIIERHLKSGSGYPTNGNAASDQTLYIRVDHDMVTVSLDSTGDLLFKRGIKQKVTQAPLRENLAAAMLFWTGFSTEDILVDPMCGSGTFSLEAAMMKTRLPPGFFRSFAFESWPGFSSRTFAHMKKQAKKQVGVLSEKLIFASDINDKALTALRQNMSHHDIGAGIETAKKDFFSIDPSTLWPGQKGVVMLNPPYGKRIGKQRNTRSFYREIGKKLATDFKGWRLGIVLPSRDCASYLGLRLQLKPIYHGGLDVFAGVGTI